MQIKLITVAFDPDSAGFPGDPLAEIEGEVVHVVEPKQGSEDSAILKAVSLGRRRFKLHGAAL